MNESHDGVSDSFEAFVRATEPALRRALVGYYGPDLGIEATAEALAWAWSTWPRCEGLDNPVGYLFRVGQTRSRRARRRLPRWQAPRTAARDDIDYEPGLAGALGRLSRNQRIAVVLHIGFEWTLAEIAATTSVSRGTVQRHLERGLRRLRQELGEGDEE